ncbi:hypothetical protein [Clostridium sp.]|uniref:hypothetical protein n=1 Tax=Clostridium sp. TaxID=1506 RepID=UPI00321756B2
MCKTFSKYKTYPERKKGGVIIVGGGDGRIEDAYTTACTILHNMNSREIAPIIYSHDTNNISSKDDIKAMESSKNLALFFNDNA